MSIETTVVEVSAGTAARILNLSVADVEQLCREGALRARRIGKWGWWRVEYDSVLDLHKQKLEARKTK